MGVGFLWAWVVTHMGSCGSTAGQQGEAFAGLMLQVCCNFLAAIALLPVRSSTGISASSSSSSPSSLRNGGGHCMLLVP